MIKFLYLNDNILLNLYIGVSVVQKIKGMNTSPREETLTMKYFPPFSRGVCVCVCVCVWGGGGRGG